MEGMTKSLIAAFQTDGSRFIVLTVLHAIKRNQSLLELNVNNNRLGDLAASAIAELLRVNKSLVKLECDSNRITLSGWQSIEYSLRRNGTLQRLEYPTQDVQRCLGQFSNNVRKQNRLMELMNQLLQTCRRNESLNGQNARLAPKPCSPPPQYAIDLEGIVGVGEYTPPPQPTAEEINYNYATDYDQPPAASSSSYSTDYQNYDYDTGAAASDSSVPPAPAWNGY